MTKDDKDNVLLLRQEMTLSDHDLFKNQIEQIADKLKKQYKHNQLPSHIHICGAGICGLMSAYLYARAIELAGLHKNVEINIYDRKQKGDIETSAGSGGSLRVDEPGVIDVTTPSDLKQQLMTPYSLGGLLINETLKDDYRDPQDTSPPQYKNPESQQYINELFKNIQSNAKNKAALLNFGNLSIQYWRSFASYLKQHEHFDIAKEAGFVFDSKICIKRSEKGHAKEKALEAVKELEQYLVKGEYDERDLGVVDNDEIYKSHPEFRRLIDKSKPNTVAFYIQPGGMINTKKFLDRLETILEAKKVKLHFEHVLENISTQGSKVTQLHFTAAGKKKEIGGNQHQYVFAIRTTGLLYKHNITSKLPSSDVVGGTLRIKISDAVILENLTKMKQQGTLPHRHIASKNDLGPPVFNPTYVMDDEGNIVSYEMIAGGFRAFAGEGFGRDLNHEVYQWFISKLCKELIEIYPDFMEAVFGEKNVASIYRIAQKATLCAGDFEIIKNVFDATTQNHAIKITPWACARPLSSNISPTVGKTNMDNAWTIAEAGSYGISYSIALAFRGLQKALDIKEPVGEKKQRSYHAEKYQRLDMLMNPLGCELS